MRSAFIFPAVVICVSSVFSQQPFVRYSENLKKVVPNHYKNDKENTYRSLDQIARGHKVEPRQPPLKPEPSIPWFQWLQQGRWAAHADRNTELHKVRARLLEQKLKPNQLAFRPRIDPQQKPNLKPAERNSIKRNTENVEVKKESNVRTRHKRDVAMTQVKPAIHHQETKMSGTEQFGGGESEKRDKRQILYFINSPNRPIQLMPRPPRTTPNPFIRDTHIEEYDIIRPEVGEREGMIPTIETGSSDPGSYPLVNIPQALFHFLQNAKIEIEQRFFARKSSQNTLTEENHKRVKRRMSQFRRDRKQLTRKKKIGRAKKTKVKRLAVKVRKWYDKRQKVKKKGDGTYRGGRGRKPRQHKRPRNYKPPMNETSAYDYYDSKGNIRGENEEGPDVADYLSYVSGEYSDTEEAERANQEMEKEYQEQLKRSRLQKQKPNLVNGTILEEIHDKPHMKSKKQKIKKESENEFYKEDKTKSKKDPDKKLIDKESKDREEYEKSESKRITYKRRKEDKSAEVSTSEETEEESEEDTEEGSEEESYEESEEESYEESEEETEEESEEESSKEKNREKDSTEDESSGDSSSTSGKDQKRRKFPRKYRKSPRWKQGKIGRYESDPKKIQNKQSDQNGEVKSSAIAKEQNHHKSVNDNQSNANMKDKENTYDQDEKKAIINKKLSNNVRKAARKFNFFSLSSYPIMRNFMTPVINEPTNHQGNFMNPEEHPLNRLSSLRFESPQHIAIQNLHSEPLKPATDAVSMTKSHIESRAGENMQNLQSVKADIPLQAIAKERTFTSIAQEKPRETLTLVSETKDERKKWTSRGTNHMGNIQSLKVDPVVFNSIAKNIPELEIDKTKSFMKINAHKVDTVEKSLNNHNSNHAQDQRPVITSIAKNIPQLHPDREIISIESVKKSPGIEGNENLKHNHQHKEIFNTNGLNEERDTKKVKREVDEEKHKSFSYEELSSIPESAGASMPSDEIEPASDNRR